MTQPNPTPTEPIRLSVTSLSQYIRLENCDRFLRFRLRRDEEKAFLKKWNLTIQPLTPLLKDSGAEFEQNVAARIAGPDETVIDLDGQELAATIQWLTEVRRPTILLQPWLEAPLGRYQINGKADVLRLHRDRQQRLHLLIADIKASRRERMEHRLQVALYARLLQNLAATHQLEIGSIRGAVIHIREDGQIPRLDSDELETFDLETYLLLLDQLLTAPDSVVNRVTEQPFEQIPYHLSYKCDGCFYNAICMYDSAERLDLSLVPHLTAVEKRALHEAGIRSIPPLAGLMELPEPNSGHYELTVAPGQAAMVDALKNQWPLGQQLSLLVQRARRTLRRFDPSVDNRTFHYTTSYSALPDETEHPGLVKIFFDAQRDYLQDRLYLLSALVVGPQGQQSVARLTPAPPTDQAEQALLLDWVPAVITAARQVAAGPQTPVHLYCYNRYDQRTLLEALKRHLEQVAGLPAFFDLLTQSPALTQSIITFLATELQERRNLGLTCAPLHDVARMLGFDWSDDQYDYYRLFRARLFDNRRPVIRQTDGRLSPVKAGSPPDTPGRLTIEAASRFNSQIPLEYAYAAWGRLPEGTEDSRLLAPFRAVTLTHLAAFAAHRVRALAHIENSFRVKGRFIEKPPLNLAKLTGAAAGPPDLARSLQDFLYMEHHTALQAKLLTYSLPIERRVQTGLALLLRFQGEDPTAGVHRFGIEFTALGLDPTLTMHALRLKEGDWVLLNPAEPGLSAGKIKGGRLATIAAIGPDWLELNLLGVSFWKSVFRYPHDNKLTPEPGRLYTLDEMADDMNADKSLEALRNLAGNVLYHWLQQRPAERPVEQQTTAFLADFINLVNTLEKHALTRPQQEVVARRLAEPLFLVQGPPGTGKSYTLSWAILARLAAAAAAGRPYRVAVSCKTHNAVNIVLGAVAEKLARLLSFPTPAVASIKDLLVFKLVNDAGDELPPGVTPLPTYQPGNRAWPQELEGLLARSLVVIGGTPGGLYNLMKYQARGGRRVPWGEKAFDLVVIDEASQMSLPEGLLACAFLRDSGQAIVVGDHRQMPPIIAHNWEDEQLRTATASRPWLSLFESLIERDFPISALDESFRLHRTIARFLQDNVYVQDGIRFFSRRQALLDQPPPVDGFVDRVLDPAYPIVVIEHGEQQSQQYNETELALVKPLIEICAHQLRLDGLDGIGAVVPHRAQKAILRQHFPELAVTDSIDTVERFQGGERDVIIVSATVSDPDYALAEAGFLLNLNRLNVALSRPRKKLIVVASRAVVNLLTSDLEIFDQAVIWKRLYYQYAARLLWHGDRDGVPVWVRGVAA